MKLFSLLLVLMICPFAYAGSPDSVLSASTQQAQITFNEETFDFGEIEQGVVVEHVFAFSNTGNDTLRIRGVRSS